MAELLASNEDINTWLPADKLEANLANTAKEQIDAQRLIRGQLAGVFTPVIIAGWADPDTTPDLIRGVAGRLIAAFLYRKVYSEDSTDIPEYAQTLYNEAIGTLTGIRAGNIIVTDSSGNPIGDNQLDMSSSDFWPNDTTAGPYFTMDQSFG